MKGVFLGKLSSLWVLALIPAILLSAFFITPDAQRYSIEISNAETSNNQILYRDLNGDGITECIQTGRASPFNFVLIQDNNQAYYEQWNVPDELAPTISKTFTGNFDGDKSDEIYLFTLKGDSIFIHINEYFDPRPCRINRQFITTVKLVDGHNTSSLEVAGFFDSNGDGKKELYFSITTGFGLEPRLVYSFDISNLSLAHSDFTGINVNGPVMADVDGDARPEVFGFSTASGNYHTPTPYSDNSAWLMIYDDQLRLKFKPKEYPGFANALYTYSYRSDGHSYFFTSLVCFGKDSVSLTPRIQLYDPAGDLVRETELKSFGNFSTKHLAFVWPQASGDQIVLITDRILLLNENFEVVAKHPLPFAASWYETKFFDVNGDGKDELLLYSPLKSKLAFFEAGFELYGVVSAKFSDYVQFSTVSDGERGRVYLKSGEIGSFIDFSENSIYWLSYGLYPLIYFFFVGFIAGVKKINAIQFAKREALRKEILALQLGTVNKQLDPHFTSNVLNSVASFIFQKDRESAYDTLTQFARLVQQVLKDSGNVFRTLGEELDFVDRYLALERIRFMDKFRYAISVGEAVTRRECVPKMVVQIFAENAVRHAFSNSHARHYVLEINVDRVGDHLLIVIQDNGVGRKNAVPFTSTGKGLRITAQFHEILNSLYPNGIAFSITDLYDSSGASAGTKAEVRISRTLFESAVHIADLPEAINK
ncbi:MAG TPA: histidine kinase [Chryseosolibacter sp.]|nr:histidine kinase [Chryseosolibacter sp.]